MEIAKKCPRGHDLEPDAVYCTTCWIRVVPEDPAAKAARQRRRRRIWIPFFGATAVLAGVVVGGILASSSSTQDTPVIVADAPTSSVPASTPDADPMPAPATSEPVTVTVPPEAATVASPSGAPTPSCNVFVLEQTVDCALDADILAFEVCVPDTTAAITARMRGPDETGWQDAASVIDLGAPGACPAGQITAGVELGADATADDAVWRLIGSNAAGDRVWRSRLDVSTS